VNTFIAPLTSQSKNILRRLTSHGKLTVQRNRIGRRKGGEYARSPSSLCFVGRCSSNLAADLPGNQVPLQPWTEALLKDRMETPGKDYPASRCLPPSCRTTLLAGGGEPTCRPNHGIQ
jgi:hypothetical protein